MSSPSMSNPTVTPLAHFLNDLTTRTPGKDGAKNWDVVRVPDNFLRIDTATPAHLKLKASLYREHPDLVYSTIGESTNEACAELLKTVVEQLTTNFPQIYQLNGHNLTNRVSNQIWNLKGDIPPLALAGQIAPEDFVIMQPRATDKLYIMTAASLSFPSNWLLSEKIGKTFVEIHSPVPLVNEHLAARVNTFLEILKVGSLTQRLNISFELTPDLPQIPGYRLNSSGLLVPYQDSEAQESLSEQDVKNKVFLRIERQTFIRLPDSEAVVFGIRLSVIPMSDITREPAKKLHELFSAMQHKILEERNMSMENHTVIMDYLAKISQ